MKVKLPGTSADKPNVYPFDTPYENIYQDLCQKDKKAYTNNGVLDILDRNRRIKRNPENHDYYTKLAEAADAQSEEKHLAIYTEYRAMFPKAQAPQRLPLNVANGNYYNNSEKTLAL